MKGQRGSINSQVKPGCASNHHNDYKALSSKHCDARPHMGGNKQSACRSSHRKPDAFEDMGNFSYAESHRGNPQIELTRKVITQRSMACVTAYECEVLHALPPVTRKRLG